MKLLFCPRCWDVRKLGPETTTCECGEVSGRYVNELDAEWNGKGHLLGFSNPSLADAIHNQNRDGDLPSGWGRKFEAFIIPTNAPTVKIT